MHVTVFLFARLRELAGTDRAIVELPTTATANELRSALIQRYPHAAELLRRSAIAINNQYAADVEFVQATDELAVIPPVSGGAIIVIR